MWAMGTGHSGCSFRDLRRLPSTLARRSTMTPGRAAMTATVIGYTVDQSTNRGALAER